MDWHFQAQAAATEVRSLMGVIGVSNLITVKVHVDVATIGHDITHALHRSWFWDPDGDNVSVTANGGAVRLTGQVDSWHDRQVAANTAWAAPGTVSVENLITVD